jgi:MFS family permease
MKQREDRKTRSAAKHAPADEGPFRRSGEEPATLHVVSADRRIVVPALGATQILAWGSTFYLLGVLAHPISRETGWSYDWVIGGVSAGLLVAGAVSPHVGRAIGQWGGRAVLAFGAVVLAAGLILLGLTQSFTSYLAAWLVLGIGMGASLYDAAFSTLGKIFGQGARGAITFLTLFGGFASTVCWPLSAYLVEHIGWRGACFAYAALQVGFALPVHLLALPRGTDPVQLAAASSEATPQAQLVPSEWPAFVLLSSVLTLGASILSMVGVHLLPLLQARGMELSAAVVLGTLVGPSQVFARVIEGLVGRHYHPIWTMVASAVLVATGALLLLPGPSIYAIAVVLYGAGNGIGSVARGTLPLALFGARRYPVIMGRLALPILMAMAFAPLAGAVALQKAGADVTLALLVAIAFLNVALVGLLWLVSIRIRNQPVQP